MPRAINDAGLKLIEGFESCALSAYRDVAGIWTIGYGHIKGVGAGMTITKAQAEVFLRADLLEAEFFVAHAVTGVATTNNEYAAMVSLCFNIGCGNFRTASVLRQHLAREAGLAAEAFLKWDMAHVDGRLVEVPGLLNRRKAERLLYLTAE